MALDPIHLAATEEDLLGNGGLGRYLLVPGSRHRAEQIAARLEDHTVKPHPRGHDLHTGTVTIAGKPLDVGVISTGMGCPSVDLIVTELIALGARVLLRVGTSGSLQPHVHPGDVVVATAAVRDEAASDDYLPREFPAVASWPMLLAAQRAAAQGRCAGEVHFGVVHTKDTLYGREFELGPLAEEHRRYNRLLQKGGVLASEMECAHLFVLAQLGKQAKGKKPVLAGAILGVIGAHDRPFSGKESAQQTEQDAIDLAFATLAEL